MTEMLYMVACSRLHFK